MLMKGILHERKKNVFQNWLHGHLLQKYIWAQICYDINNYESIHIVLEKNSNNSNFIDWPLSKLDDIACTNIDFTVEPPQLDDGNRWDFCKWHLSALKCRLMSEPSHIPTSFWNWRRETRPQGNLTCDLDCLCVNKYGTYIGIEATEIYFVNDNENIEKDVYEHFKRLFTLRKGKAGGFNIAQLKAQKAFLDKLDGKLYMLFHKLIEHESTLQLYEEKILLLIIEDETISEIQQLIKTKYFSDTLKHRIEFCSIGSAFKKIGI